MVSAILSRLVFLHSPRTKAAAAALLRRCRADGVTLPAGRQSDMAALLVTLTALRSQKRDERNLRRTVAVQPTLAKRLAVLKAERRSSLVAAVAAAARGLYRVSESRWAGGDHTTTVHVADHVGCSGDSRRVWSRNGKWSGKDSSHQFTVRRTWLVDVHARGLAVVDGMLTLDAEPVQGHGPELFRAAWVEQGRGFDLNCRRGYIARLGDVTYHAASARAALDGVMRKAGHKPARRAGVVDLEKLARRHGDLPVYFDDARAVGACASGIRSWCEALGISSRETTLAEVVAGYKLRPMPEAMAVIRRVVRDRHNRQPLDLESLNGAASIVTEGRIVFDSEGGFRIENN